MTTTITVAAIIGAILGIGLTRLWDFLWDALDRRDTRDAIRGVGGHPEAQRSTPPNAAEAVPAPDPRPELIITKRCPEGWSAKQVLGRGDVRKRWIEPQFPGGLEAWDRMHDARATAREVA